MRGGVEASCATSKAQGQKNDLLTCWLTRLTTAAKSFESRLREAVNQTMTSIDRKQLTQLSSSARESICFSRRTMYDGGKRERERGCCEE
jgi:ribosomal protein L20